MIAFLLGMLLAVGSVSGPGDEVLLQAERAYRAGRYAEALNLYQTVLLAGDAPRGTVLYNLGNCAYRLRRPAEAVLFYRRALLRIPFDPEVRANLRLAEREVGLAPPPEESVAVFLVKWVDWLRPGELLALVIGLQGAGLLGLLLLRRSGAARTSMGLLVLLGLLGAARLVQLQWFAGPPAGVVLAQEIGLRPEPHVNIGTNIRLRAGDTVRVEEMSDRWIRVVHAHGDGWTERSGVGVVE